MSVLGDFFYTHFHEKISAFLGAGVSVLAPGDIFAKIFIGTCTGVSVWCITRTISWLAAKWRKKCQCDACKE